MHIVIIQDKKHVVSMSGGVISELNGCLKGKMLILEDLNFTIEEKKKIEDKLEAAIETN